MVLIKRVIYTTKRVQIPHILKPTRLGNTAM